MSKIHLVNILFWLCIFVLTTTSGQVDPQFSHYMFVNPNVNPASAGINNASEIALLVRYQWAGYKANSSSSEGNGSPVSQLLVANTKIKSLNSGIGFNIMNETLGPLSNFTGRFNYSYHIKINDGVLGLGMGIGIYYQNIDALKLKPNDLNDPLVVYLRRNPNSLNADISSGIFYKNDVLYLGLSGTHLNSPSYNDSTKAILSPQYYITGGYRYRISEVVDLCPSIIIKSNFTELKQASFDFSGLIKYNNDQLWAGLSYRSGIFKPDALIAILGIGLIKNNSLKVGYSFDLTVLGNTAKSGTSHEIMLTYSKPVQDILPKPIIRTPRYRF